MVFSSMLFVFLFLAANLVSQAVLKTTKAKNIAMVVFSLIFYGWAGPKYLLLLLGMVLICFLGGLMVEKAQEQSMRKTYMIITVALCLVILGIFKYTGFFLSNIQAILGVPKVIPEIALPIGISFYTFQLLSYVVDVYRGEVEAQKKYWMLLLYASLFHQCVAGPIVRYQDVCEDIEKRKNTIQEISNGISRFTIGLAKKAILANGCAVIADGFFAVTTEELAVLPVLGVMLGALAYMLQIYLDFSAYSDMAIGMGLMCGFHYKENFNYPYLADSAGEFWRRWHISLSSFFRDYVYIPLGGNRCKVSRQMLNLFVVWFLTGMWHGANWNFIFWGLYYLVFQVLERFILKERFTSLPKAVRHIYLLVVVYIGWIIFKFTDMTQLGIVLKGLVGLNGNGFTNVNVTLTLKNNIFFLLFAAISVTSFGKTFRLILKNLSRRGGTWFVINGVWEVVHPVLLLVLSAMALVGDSYNPFLYFQF